MNPITKFIKKNSKSIPKIGLCVSTISLVGTIGLNSYLFEKSQHEYGVSELTEIATPFIMLSDRINEILQAGGSPKYYTNVSRNADYPLGSTLVVGTSSASGLIMTVKSYNV